MPSVLELYEMLKPKLGEEEARSLLEFVETSVEQRAATKADLDRSESSLREEIHRVEPTLREGIHRVEATLRKEIQDVKVDLLKWSFGFWVGAILILPGIMFTLIRTLPTR